MQASITQLIFIALAVAVAAIVSVVVFTVIRDEGDSIADTRNQAAHDACTQAGGTYHWAATGALPAAATARSALPTATPGLIERLGECRFSS